MKPRVVLFGTGAGGKRGWAHLGKRAQVIGFCDNDPQQQGQTFCGLPVYAPQDLAKVEFERLIICSVHHQAIMNQLLNQMRIPIEKIEILDADVRDYGDELPAKAAADRSRFFIDFFSHLLGSVYDYQSRYAEGLPFQPLPPKSLLEKIKHRLRIVAASWGWGKRYFSLASASKALAYITARPHGFASGYTLLADDYSRFVYLSILAFRALGSRHVALPANRPEFWQAYLRDEHLIVRKNTDQASMGECHWALHLYDVPGKTGPLHLHMTTGSYQYYFLMRSYDYDHDEVKIGVMPGDVVINGGGCWGETDIMFADRCAPHGRVYSFEFEPNNLRILHKNFAENSELAKRIEVVNRALSDKSDRVLSFTPSGPSTRVVQASGAKETEQKVITLTVDDLVAQKKLDRVDFIKLDIEGSELSALQGAEKTLRRFRPRLAISAYHQPQDLYELVLYLSGLQLGYRFYMDHFTVHLYETVLFAVCDGLNGHLESEP